jgi:hypothetical protein
VSARSSCAGRTWAHQTQEDHVGPGRPHRVKSVIHRRLRHAQPAGQIRANRWQRIGRAVVLHDATPSVAELRRAALIVLGPRAALTSLTALAEWGLTGWDRAAIHVLVPRGARVVRPAGLPLRVHYTGTWSSETIHPGRQLHRPAHAAVVAAAGFAHPRPACGILAAAFQQRLVRAGDLVDASNARLVSGIARPCSPQRTTSRRAPRR